MKNSNRYEHPQPVLSVDTDSVLAETRDVYKGQLKIRNTGGGMLRGKVLSRCKGLSFEPSEFEGNSTINYTFNAQIAGLGIGETINSKFFITSNGGEKEIPVSAKLIKMSISTADGHTIANIHDFYEYSITHPAQARRLFTDSEFYMLLLATGYEFMEIYESLHKDANRERAMDNFFILSGLKGRTNLKILGAENDIIPQMEFSQNPINFTPVKDEIKIQKSDNGYVEAPLILKNESPWLTLSSGKLTAADFDENNTATVKFTINPTKMNKKSTVVREQIIVGTTLEAANSVEIVYRKLPALLLHLTRDTYRYSDRGSIEVTNNTGKNIQVSVFCPENYIRFSARSFAIGERGHIPFEIKLSAFMNAQMLFRKLPFMKTVIEITAKTTGQEFKKTLPIVVGEW